MRAITRGGAVALLLAAPILASAATVRVASVEGTSEAVVEVPVDIAGLSGVRAFRVELRYDATVLSPEKVVADPRMMNVSLEANLKESGWLAFNGASPKAIEGEGGLARIRFKVIGKGGDTSALTPEHCRVWDGKGTELFVSAVPGQVKVVTAIPWPWIAIGGGALLLLIVVGTLASRGRRAAPAPVPASPQAVVKPLPAVKTPAAVTCAKCGAEVKPAAKFCGKCGAPRGGPRECAKCGAALAPDVKFCEQCGAAS